LRKSPASGPVVDVTRLLVVVEVFAGDVRVAAPHHQLVHPVGGFGRCDHGGAPAVAPAQHRVPVDAQRLRPKRAKQQRPPLYMVVSCKSNDFHAFAYFFW